MASDTATLDLEAIRAEARRQSGASPRVELGPEDRAPEGTGPIDTDPATRAHLIVQEVLAAAAQRETPAPAEPTIPVTPDNAAAAQARRIVEEVLAAAEQAAPAGRTDVDATAAPAPVRHRADLVLLGVESPVVLLPGDTYAPTPSAFVPPARRSLDSLVTRALETIEDDATVAAPYHVEIDETRASQDLREAIQKAAASDRMHPTRWIVAGLVWAVSFAVAVPVLMNGLVSSVDLTVDLWGDEGTVATQPAEGDIADVAAE